jgi:hypothetical protein
MRDLVRFLKRFLPALLGDREAVTPAAIALKCLKL